jgi:hypoxanthine phosphoribosyltransferase
LTIRPSAITSVDDGASEDAIDDFSTDDGASGVPEQQIVARDRKFAHPAEAEFAAYLDFYRIRWRYEPRSFPLRWRDGRVAEMFTPDFYLPEQDLFIELTTMKQSLVTRKHRKVRRLRELYPNVNIALVHRKAFHELLSRFGYGSVEITSLREEDIERILLSSAEIQARVSEMGALISRDYAGESLVLIGLLKGVTFYLADLARAITRPLAIDYLSVATPSHAPGGVTIDKHLEIDISGKHVLLVEDIVNTGITMNFVLDHLRSHNPASLQVCALLDKSERRLIPIETKYIGFTIPNEYVVGYGLDHRELYRNLPFICVLKRHVYEHHPTDGILQASADGAQLAESRISTA